MSSLRRPFLLLSVILSSIIVHVSAHGDHGAHDFKDGPSDWASMHMREEHHIDSFDATSFFNLHDFDSAGIWTSATIRRFYGLEDESAIAVPETRKAEVVKEVLSIFDLEQTGVISRDQFVRLSNAGRKLPDFGLGPGHHGDDEYEYEIHHFEKYHSGDNVREEDLNHPEDIEHFRKHDQMEDEQRRLVELEKMAIVERNIPLKFRRDL